MSANLYVLWDFGNQDNVAGIATTYRLDCSGSLTRRGSGRFCVPYRLAPRPIRPPVQLVPGLFLWGKSARQSCWPPTLSSAEVNHGYSNTSTTPRHSLPPVACYGVTFTSKTSLKTNQNPLSFQAWSHIREKRLLARPCPPVYLSAIISAAFTQRIFVKFDIRDFYENLSGNSKYDQNWANILGTLH